VEGGGCLHVRRVDLPHLGFVRPDREFIDYKTDQHDHVLRPPAGVWRQLRPGVLSRTCTNVQRFREGLVFKAHRLVHHTPDVLPPLRGFLVVQQGFHEVRRALLQILREFIDYTTSMTTPCGGCCSTRISLTTRS